MHRTGRRAEWSAVPAGVRAAVDELLSASVTTATNVAGGFSPGPAARCRLSDGRTVFIKACGVELNPVAPLMHRREAAILGMLPADYPAPQLLGVVDNDDWVVLVVSFVVGRMPTAPLDVNDVEAVLNTVDAMMRRAMVMTSPKIERFAQRMASTFSAWRRAADEGLEARLDAWSRRHLDALVELESSWIEATTGDALVHGDLRTDNMMIGGSGEVTVVDWPNASLGQPWIDFVALLPSLHLDGAPPPGVLFDRQPMAARADPHAVNSFLVALAGYFTRQSLQPPPPGIATVRSFQSAQGSITRAWLAERLGWH